MATVEKLNYLLETKNQIKNAITAKGVSITDTDSFRSYASKIGQIEGESVVQDDFWNLRTQNGTNARGLFAYLSDELQQSTEFIEYIENLDTSNITDFSNLFYEDKQISILDLKKWNTSNVETLQYAFYGNANLELLDLTGWDTSNCTNISGFLYGCQKLVEVKGVLNFINVDSLANFFGGSASLSAKSLEKIYIKNLNRTGFNLTFAIALTHESLMFLINNLVPTQSIKRLTLGPTNLAKLTKEEIAIATDEKGWTLS